MLRKIARSYLFEGPQKESIWWHLAAFAPSFGRAMRS